jgi:hypothetical protein
MSVRDYPRCITGDFPMPAPVRVRFQFANGKVSAFYLGDTGEVVPPEPVCKHCSPLKTKMLHTHTLTIHKRGVDQSFHVFKCAVCKRQWAIGWQNKNAVTEGL